MAYVGVVRFFFIRGVKLVESQNSTHLLREVPYMSAENLGIVLEPWTNFYFGTGYALAHEPITPEERCWPTIEWIAIHVTLFYGPS